MNNSSLNKALGELVENLNNGSYSDIHQIVDSWAKEWILELGQQAQVNEEVLKRSSNDDYRKYMERKMALECTEAIWNKCGTCDWTKDNKPLWDRMPKNYGYGGKILQVKMYVLRREKL